MLWAAARVTASCDTVILLTDESSMCGRYGTLEAQEGALTPVNRVLRRSMAITMSVSHSKISRERSGSRQRTNTNFTTVLGEGGTAHFLLVQMAASALTSRFFSRGFMPSPSHSASSMSSKSCGICAPRPCSAAWYASQRFARRKPRRRSSS
jgi:hypothetical protein